MLNEIFLVFLALNRLAACGCTFISRPVCLREIASISRRSVGGHNLLFKYYTQK